jgi:chromate transporter
VASAEPAPHGVPFREAFRFWLKLGFVNFGGPTGQIAIMHDELVVKRRWISNGRFLHALSYCTLLPGPEAQQLAIYVGWLLHKVKGGITAGVLFVLPAFFLILGLSWVFVVHGDVSWVAAIFSGLRAAVIGIVAAAGIRIGMKALRNPFMVGVAVAAFASIFFLHVAFPVVIISAGALGLVAGSRWPGTFLVADEAGDDEHDVAIGDEGPAAAHTRVSLRRGLAVLAVGLTVWVAPLVAIALWRGSGDTLTDMAFFFSKAALVTFGGAYAVLAYINQAAVLRYGWLLPGQMVAGLGLAESTPGPLIMVTEFVGYVGAYRNPGGLDPAMAGALGALVATWATFAPCFLWIFLGAPFIERLRGNTRLSAGLSTITAAVVGVIASLAVTFGILTLFERVRSVEAFGGPVPVPIVTSIDPFVAAVALAAFLGMWRFRWNVVWVVIGAVLAGLLHLLVS